MSDDSTESHVVDQSSRISGAEFKGSPSVDALLYFAEPEFGVQSMSTSRPIALPGGKLTNLAISVVNKHTGTDSLLITLHSIEASLHYPNYYSYHIQNFTTFRLQNTLEPKQEASVSYFFIPHGDLIGQSYDLAVAINYYDQMGNVFRQALFNRTISVYEEEEPLDTETFFRLIIQAGIVFLLGIGTYSWFTFSNLSSTQPSNETNRSNNLHLSKRDHNLQISSTKRATNISSESAIFTAKPVNDLANLNTKRQKRNL